VMPFMSASGHAWRAWIGPDTMFYRNHGAYLDGAWNPDERQQSTSATACYTTGAHHYFGWQDADKDDARTLADKFLARFTRLAGQGEGWSYAYAGWYQRLLGLAERGWMPVVIDDDGCSTKKINLYDRRPAEWRTENEKEPSLPLPPGGKSQRTIKLHGPSIGSEAVRPAGPPKALHQPAAGRKYRPSPAPSVWSWSAMGDPRARLRSISAVYVRKFIRASGRSGRGRAPGIAELSHRFSNSFGYGRLVSGR
jgi:hypothetical protein